MTALQLFLILILLGGLMLFALGYLAFNRPAAGEGGPAEVPAPSEESLRRRRRRNAWTRVMFVFLTFCLAAHRAMVVYMILLMDGSNSSSLKESVGMTLIFFDPFGILFSIGGGMLFKSVTGLALVPDKDLSALYIVGATLLDALVVWFLWRLSRHAFVRSGAGAAPEGSQPRLPAA